MKTVTILTTCGKSITIDEADAVAVGRHTWRTNPAGYVYANPRIGGGKRMHIYIHRLIMGARSGESVDHVNHDKADNRRSNLRLCDDSLNHGNMRLRSDNTSGAKGVRWDGYSFRAKVTFRGVTHYLGGFDTRAAAICAYNEKAKELFGEFALLNQEDADRQEFERILA